MTILFPHIPKTGGTSFLKALKTAYGDRLLIDYENNQRHKSKTKLWLKKYFIGCMRQKISSKYDVIYGHFDPTVFQLAKFDEGMFFRDPTDRAISHYNYLLSRKKIPTALTLGEFVAKPQIMHIYSYYCKLSVDNLTFVGITERYKESLELFREMFGVELTEYRERIGSSKLKFDFEKIDFFQKDNQRIYDQALKRFDHLYREYL